MTTTSDRQAARHCRLTLDALDREVLTLDVNGTIISANTEARRLIDAPMGDGSDLGNFLSFWKEPSGEVTALLRRLAGTSTWQPFSLTRVSGAHAGLRMNLRGRALFEHTDDGGVLSILVTADTHRERAFEDHRRLIRSLNMQLAEGSRAETLMARMLESEKHLRQELVHRVKNNLSLLSALVRINAQRTDSVEARGQLAEMERRILSVATVHELLDRTQETDYVRADKLIQKICEALESSLAPGSVTIERDLVPVRLHITDATPLALIINELVTNALKHAFPTGSPGRISIGLKKNGVEKLEAVVHDNGIGMSMPTGGDNQGTGKRILESLALQLNGEIVQTIDDGTTWQLIFQPRAELNEPEPGLH